jgi:hypothetical protein
LPDGTAGPIPAVGSEVYVWINESGGGRGLTAKAQIDSVGEDGKSYHFVLRNIQLLAKPMGMDDARRFLPESRLIVEMKAYRPERIWFVSDSEVASLDDLILKHGGFRFEDNVDAPWLEAISSESGSIENEEAIRKKELRWGRPEQRAFREAAMLRHNGKCVFTGCRVIEAIHAAHVIPHTGHSQFERPDNSLILRMDIHGLFDAHLISITPDSSIAVVSSRLAKTAYSKLMGKVINHKLAHFPLSDHYRRFVLAQTSEIQT